MCLEGRRLGCCAFGKVRWNVFVDVADASCCLSLEGKDVARLAARPIACVVCGMPETRIWTY